MTILDLLGSDLQYDLSHYAAKDKSRVTGSCWRWAFTWKPKGARERWLIVKGETLKQVVEMYQERQKEYDEESRKPTKKVV